MIKNIYFTYCLIPIIIAKNEIVQHEVYIVANIVPDVRPGCLYRSAKAATIGSSLTQGFAVLRAAFYHWQQVLSPLSIFIMFLEEAMQELKDRIVKEGKILPGNIVKVDGFLNHRVDCAFMGRIADEFKKYFDLDNVDLILTAEASGIALSAICAYRYGKPMVYAKKAKSDNIEGGLYQSEIFSYTYKKKVTLLVSKEWIHPGDRVLVIDDFLARGEALRGLCEIVQAAGAELVGIGCAVEKGFPGILVETIAIFINNLAAPANTKVFSLTHRLHLTQPQAYIFDPELPYWIIYRNQLFDSVCRKLDFDVFEVFRDRQLTNKLLSSSGELRVLKSRNLSDDGKEILDIPGYDSYISYAAAKPLSVFQYLDAPNVYLTPNMTYKPRMMKKPPHCVVNGSLAILIPKGGIVPTEKQLAYFSSEEYRAFYQIARNFQTRSLNVDACSVFFYGLLRDEARPAPEKFDTSVQLSFL